MSFSQTNVYAASLSFPDSLSLKDFLHSCKSWTMESPRFLNILLRLHCQYDTKSNWCLVSIKACWFTSRLSNFWATGDCSHPRLHIAGFTLMQQAIPAFVPTLLCSPVPSELPESATASLWGKVAETGGGGGACWQQQESDEGSSAKTGSLGVVS